jgi:hypothetical protein
MTCARALAHNSAAQASDAGPPPMQATRRFFVRRFRRRRSPDVVEEIHGVALQQRNLNRLAILPMHHACALAKHFHRAHPRTAPPRMLASRMRNAEPRRLPEAMRLINPGTSICVGQAAVQGASKQLRQRSASMTAACDASAGFSSLNAKLRIVW